ncbi:AbgT family transporter [Fusibacter tunisiensis]|uniref:Ion transporter superfamily protein YfcC n=1 Tax=Fusibacter tunisiensis TaxID=1008308 RepID=A0ABS2MTM2_9FIRM|nr:AbgT family transporter [Fusibacter tunisiensis]MBM7562756.1 putative ion transporter superfamily protein YfcC [Fusibacter tunisiensis]
MKLNPAVKSFISAFVILLVLFIVTGISLYVIPGANSNWAWPLASILVLGSDSGGMIIAITIFLLIIGGAIHILKETGLIEGVISATVLKFKDKSFLLMALLVLLFMSMGAFVGVFEEVVPLVPLMILLSKRMGWDDLTGLGISILACGLGFAAAVSNPFTIGVAQQLADLPMFSGALLRMGVFATVYTVLLAFLWTRSKHIKGTVLEEDDLSDLLKTHVPQNAYVFFVALMVGMAIFITASPFVSFLRDISLPVIALVFLIAGLGVGMMANGSLRWVFKTYLKGAVDMSPAIVLILLATGIKHLMVEGALLEIILEAMAENSTNYGAFTSILIVFVSVLGLNFFIGSGSAKAFILMPVVVPMMDMIGVSRQLGVLAFQFGDGFSNVLYPTNAVLLIALGISGVGYGKWLKFILPIQVILLILSVAWLWLGYQIGYGG